MWQSCDGFIFYFILNNKCTLIKLCTFARTGKWHEVQEWFNCEVRLSLSHNKCRLLSLTPNTECHVRISSLLVTVHLHQSCAPDNVSVGCCVVCAAICHKVDFNMWFVVLHYFRVHFNTELIKLIVWAIEIIVVIAWALKSCCQLIGMRGAASIKKQESVIDYYWHANDKKSILLNKPSCLFYCLTGLGCLTGSYSEKARSKQILLWLWCWKICCQMPLS